MASFDDQTATKIQNQVEFYFSDSNLPRDTFLQKTVSESKDGMVSLALICSFSRMRNHLGLGKLQREEIPERILVRVAEILRNSKSLKVSDNGKKVGRLTELAKPEVVLEQVDRRTIAASPFEHNVKIEEVKSFFSQYHKVNSVRLPHHVADKRFFGGTALIEFSTDKDANKILKENLMYAGAELVLKPKKEFDSERGKMMKDTETSHSNTSGSYCKGQLVAFSLKRIDILGKETEKDGAGKSRKRKHKSEKIRNEENSEKSEEATTKKNEEKNSDRLVCHPSDKSLGSVRPDGEEKASDARDIVTPPVKEGDFVSSKDLEDRFESFGTVKHVDYTPGSDSGYICFQDAEIAIKARAAVAFVEGGLIMKKKFAVVLEAVNAEAEQQYWKSFNAEGECQESRDSEERKTKRMKHGKESETEGETRG